MVLPQPEELKDFRRKLHLTQRQLADALGLQQSHVSKIEAGECEGYLTVKSLWDYLEGVERKGMNLVSSRCNYGLEGVQLSDSIRKAASIMDENDYSQLVVFNDSGKIIGALSYKPLLRAFRDGLQDSPVADFIEKRFPEISENDHLLLAYPLLEKSPALLVISERGKTPVGILTPSDLTKVRIPPK